MIVEIFGQTASLAEIIIVVGDGVRLRKGPSLTSTVLELMDKGEVVSINVDKSQLSKGYFYVKRLKTGTRGYASTKYII